MFLHQEVWVSNPSKSELCRIMEKNIREIFGMAQGGTHSGPLIYFTPGQTPVSRRYFASQGRIHVESRDVSLNVINCFGRHFTTKNHSSVCRHIHSHTLIKLQTRVRVQQQQPETSSTNNSLLKPKCSGHWWRWLLRLGYCSPRV
ncbi:hypothetical protein YC2023_077756 [Brassica napus]